MRATNILLHNYAMNFTRMLNGKFGQVKPLGFSEENISSLDSLLKFSTKFGKQNIVMKFDGSLAHSKTELITALDKFLLTTNVNIKIEDNNGFILIKGNGLETYNGSFQLEIDEKNLHIKVGTKYQGTIETPKFILDNFVHSSNYKINQNVTLPVKNKEVASKDTIVDDLGIIKPLKTEETTTNQPLSIPTQSSEIKLGGSEVPNPFDDSKMEQMINIIDSQESIAEQNINSYQEMEMSGSINDLFSY